MRYLLIILATLVVVGCSIKVCECNSPQKIEKKVDNNSTETEVFTVPRGI